MKTWLLLCAILCFTYLIFIPYAYSETESSTVTPIKHVIVIIAENRSFDHLFATYKAKNGETVFNLLSQGIIKEDGEPGVNFEKARQYKAEVTDLYDQAPNDKNLFLSLPPLMTGSAPQNATGAKPPFLSLREAENFNKGIAQNDLPLLVIGETGLPPHTIDTRLSNVMKLANGPYSLTPSIPYASYAASPVHRFFQMWQQMDCSASHITPANPSGCLNDLFPWVEATVGAGSSGKPQPANFSEQTTGEGSASMGFYNMAKGDAPYLNELAQNYALSDNYHQPVAGGSGANHIMLGSGDLYWFSDAKGNASSPPIDQIEDPNPQQGSNNYYKEDGYQGGSYVNCSDQTSPGVASVTSYLASLPAKLSTHCEPGHYYLVNNFEPGYSGSGERDSKDPFVLPPTNVRTIGDLLFEKNISARYFGEGWNDYLKTGKSDLYCTICNFFQYSASSMTNSDRRQHEIGDLDDFYAAVANNSLPAVSFIKPSDMNDGHPASSRVDIFEAFAHRLIGAVQANKDVWKDTAIFVTFDEAGGYWDSGYIQPLDFFGDGPRVPLIVVSPYSTGGKIVHSYTDHVSILKFIEHNWKLPPISHRSRDNLPNPQMDPAHPYVPLNGPAIGDLMDMFNL